MIKRFSKLRRLNFVKRGLELSLKPEKVIILTALFRFVFSFVVEHFEAKPAMPVGMIAKLLANIAPINFGYIKAAPRTMLVVLAILPDSNIGKVEGQ